MTEPKQPDDNDDNKEVKWLNELITAYRHLRPPNCPGCGRPLDIIYQHLTWKFDKKSGKYINQSDSSKADPPYCSSCGYQSWDFIADTAEWERIVWILLDFHLTYRSH